MDDRWLTAEDTEQTDTFTRETESRDEVTRPHLHGADELVRQLIAADLEVQPEDIKPWQRLDRDLGVTRLGLVLLGLDLEDLAQIYLPFDSIADVRTVDDLTRRLELALSRRSST